MRPEERGRAQLLGHGARLGLGHRRLPLPCQGLLGHGTTLLGRRQRPEQERGPITCREGACGPRADHLTGRAPGQGGRTERVPGGTCATDGTGDTASTRETTLGRAPPLAHLSAAGQATTVDRSGGEGRTPARTCARREGGRPRYRQCVGQGRSHPAGDDGQGARGLQHATQPLSAQRGGREMATRPVSGDRITVTGGRDLPPCFRAAPAPRKGYHQ